ncbi:MAG: hypothetical protein Q4G18_13075 [Myroides sp.]|nr:hypothetical protein [Myroides sp.]
MKKNILAIFILFVGVVSAQDKRWYSHAELDVVFPRIDKVTYSYIGGEIKLDEKLMYGLNYSYNYNIFSKFSVGAVTGFTQMLNPELTTMKIGGVFRYTFIKEYQANAFLQITGHIPLSNKVAFDLGEVRAGVSMPIARFSNGNSMTLSLYVLYNSYNIKKPLFTTEVPDIVEYRGTGLSIGYRF